MSPKYEKIAKIDKYLIHKHFLFKTMAQMPRFHAKTAELQAQLLFHGNCNFLLAVLCHLLSVQLLSLEHLAVWIVLRITAAF